jgi:hypothetical protein
VRGFYTGLSVTCCRAFPVSAVTFLLYSQTLSYLRPTQQPSTTDESSLEARLFPAAASRHDYDVTSAVSPSGAKIRQPLTDAASTTGWLRTVSDVTS